MSRPPTYDDHPTSCPLCGNGFDHDALCECPERFCVRCHRVAHVEHIDRRPVVA